MNWITEFIFVHVTWPLAHQRVDRSHVCNSMYNGLFTSVTIMVAPLKMDIARVCFTQHLKIQTHAEKSLVKCSIGFEMAAIVYVRSSVAMAHSVRGLCISPRPFAPTFPRKFSTWVLHNALMHVKADYTVMLMFLIDGVACHKSISRPRNAYITQFLTDLYSFTHSTIPCVM